MRSDAGSSSESKGEGFKIVVNVTIGSDPALWVKPFGIGEHVGIARNGPARKASVATV